MFSGKVEKEDEDRLWMKSGGEEEESEGAEGDWKEGGGFNSCVYRVSGTKGVKKRIFFLLLSD